ncbi:MAG: hypothetical protein U9O94_06735 [Nanoarchaeota archaeon]|nr:hypothetical protein [Nanoarchaeota archaeon]
MVSSIDLDSTLQDMPVIRTYPTKPKPKNRIIDGNIENIDASTLSDMPVIETDSRRQTDEEPEDFADYDPEKINYTLFWNSNGGSWTDDPRFWNENARNGTNLVNYFGQAVVDLPKNGAGERELFLTYHKILSRFPKGARTYARRELGGRIAEIKRERKNRLNLDALEESRYDEQKRLSDMFLAVEQTPIHKRRAELKELYETEEAEGVTIGMIISAHEGLKLSYSQIEESILSAERGKIDLQKRLVNSARRIRKIPHNELIEILQEINTPPEKYEELRTLVKKYEVGIVEYDSSGIDKSAEKYKELCALIRDYEVLSLVRHESPQIIGKLRRKTNKLASNLLNLADNFIKESYGSNLEHLITLLEKAQSNIDGSKDLLSVNGNPELQRKIGFLESDIEYLQGLRFILEEFIERKRAQYSIQEGSLAYDISSTLEFNPIISGECDTLCEFEEINNSIDEITKLLKSKKRFLDNEIGFIREITQASYHVADNDSIRVINSHSKLLLSERYDKLNQFRSKFEYKITMQTLSGAANEWVYKPGERYGWRVSAAAAVLLSLLSFEEAKINNIERLESALMERAHIEAVRNINTVGNLNHLLTRVDFSHYIKAVIRPDVGIDTVAYVRSDESIVLRPPMINKLDKATRDSTIVIPGLSEILEKGARNKSKIGEWIYGPGFENNPLYQRDVADVTEKGRNRFIEFLNTEAILSFHLDIEQDYHAFVRDSVITSVVATGRLTKEGGYYDKRVRVRADGTKYEEDHMAHDFSDQPRMPSMSYSLGYGKLDRNRFDPTVKEWYRTIIYSTGLTETIVHMDHGSTIPETGQDLWPYHPLSFCIDPGEGFHFHIRFYLPESYMPFNLDNMPYKNITAKQMAIAGEAIFDEDYDPRRFGQIFQQAQGQPPGSIEENIAIIDAINSGAFGDFTIAGLYQQLLDRYPDRYPKRQDKSLARTGDGVNPLGGG